MAKKRPILNGNFLFDYLLNVGINIAWTIPAWIMLVLHFLLDWPIWIFWILIGAYLVIEFIIVLILTLITR